VDKDYENKKFDFKQFGVNDIYGTSPTSGLISGAPLPGVIPTTAVSSGSGK